MTKEDWIFKVVHTFYQKAIDDVLIGYHFRNIHDFDLHIPRIASFWEIQLIGASAKKVDPSFDMLRAHLPLGIKRGELGRWILLFSKTLDENQDPGFQDLKVTWMEKIKFFEGVFLRFLGF